MRGEPLGAPAFTGPGRVEQAPEPAADGPVEWTVDPWRQRARRAALAVLAAAGAAGVAAAAGLPALTTVVLGVAAGLAFAPGYLASHCRVDAAGVARRLGPLGWERRAWDRVRVARLDDRGLFVTPGPGRGAFAAMRGLHLPIPAGGHAALRARLEQALVRHGL